MPDVKPHEWLKPKLAALMQEAEAAGIAKDVSVAVITDLINGPLSTATPPAGDDEWNRDIGEPDSAVRGAEATGAPAGIDQGEAVPNPLNHLGHRGFLNRN